MRSASATLVKDIHVAIGLMSGTSMDGIDIALIRTDGQWRVERGPFVSYPYDEAFRKRLLQGLEDAKSISEREQRPGILAELESEITIIHARHLREFLETAGLTPDDVDILGFHGQTVIHRPEKGLTVQLGDGRLLAELTGISVVHDLRANDMAHGGQGAPLIPVYHRALARNLPQPMRALRPLAFVNIGGIANITWIGRDDSLIAFDTGPGNSLIDQWVREHAGIPYDQDGVIAAEGALVTSLAERYLASPYFTRPAPKSLDRSDFPPLPAQAASLEDGARTLAHITAAAIVAALRHVPEPPALWIVSGGGARNPVILQELRTLLGAADDDKQEGSPLVHPAARSGLDGDALEAEAWAYLAVRSLLGLELTWPSTTGVSRPVSGGVMARVLRKEERQK